MEKLTNEEKAKIELNDRESKIYKAQYKELIKNKSAKSDILHLGETPLVYQILNAPKLPLKINRTTIYNSRNPTDKPVGNHSTGHNISDSVLKELPKYIREPLLILKGRTPNSLIALLDAKNKNGKYIVAPIHLNRKEGFLTVNRVATVSEKENIANYLVNHFSDILAINKEKAKQMLHSIRVQFPKENTFVSFDSSIAYTTKNVNYPKEKITRSDEKMENTINIYPEVKEIIDKISHNSGNSFTPQQEEYINQYHSIEQNTVKTEQIADYIMDNGKIPENTDFAIHKGNPVLLQTLLDYNYIADGDEKRNNINDIVNNAFAQNPSIYVLFSDLYPKEANRAMVSEAISNAGERAKNFISQVVSSMTIPKTPVEMETNPKFNSIFNEEKFKKINKAVDELNGETGAADREQTDEISVEKEQAQANETTDTIIAQRYTDISQVNTNIANELETGNLSVNVSQEQDNEPTEAEEQDIMLTLHKAADEKDDSAMNILGVCYMTGMNVAIDEVKAIDYLSQAAELENVQAMRNLAIVLENSSEPDIKRAVELYTKAADKGDSYALNNLGVCYLTGDGTQKNAHKAVYYFEKAVKAGDDFAMINLADCYSIGNGIRKNDKKAFDLYKQAADKGNIAGIKAVADILYKGIGVKQDFSEAMKFYKMAADRGDESSKAMYDTIQSKISGQKHDIKSETAIAAAKESTKSDKNNAEKARQHKNRDTR